MKKPGDKLLSFILGFSAGIMLTIVCFDLLPKAFERGSFFLIIIGILFGVLLVVFVDEKIFSHCKIKENKGFLKMSVLIGFGIALHNFPEGLAIGSGFMLTKELGIGISIVIALHNIPEGISMAVPMKVSGMSGIRSLFYTMLVGLPMGLGAFIGAVLGDISEVFVAFCLAFAGGTMLYITCGELIPKSNELSFKKISSLGLIVGFILGLFITFDFHL
ncbi:zinc transporter, ZIP family [Caminicella sporogenes DSM 14501]|uniref:Zinc transporter, ZIP family n=1 Tax=Caminicella sporogenes DSM 14501 TaxID=1121266 RepID=A0A1M6PSS3_9FIRM|nr:ZIP family metal transporter [Caminicella sporogenes]WIF96049.1 ZIP family metal transporter [Caminicella sporogenes]SHK10997.1 zinc transporter, ZIP family [Caminicella sporogenes DSM 14501]